MLAILSSPDSFQKRNEMDKIRNVIKNEGSGVIHYEVKNFDDIGEALTRFNQCGITSLVIVGGQAIASATFEHIIENKPFGDYDVPISVLSGTADSFTSQSFGATSTNITADLATILKKHNAGTLLNHLVKLPLMKVEGVAGVGKLYGLYFCTGEIVEQKSLFERILHKSGLKQTIQNYTTIASLLYKAYVGSKLSDNVDEMIRINRNQRGAVVGRYFMVNITSLSWIFLGTKFPPRKNADTLHFLSVENTKDAIMQTGKQLMKGAYGEAFLPGHTLTEIEHARLVFHKNFVVDGRYYETDEAGELLITASEKITFIRLD
ncbi:hypothetical protein [Pseudemcibacter aquimaris]|uniref:hypothetical protein n=1 Tax=Pseudemcibacter aquimaris TaxID=2857064 RepID=UPI0020135DE8|nr:hypothetical protein [Pseudemcibacter aquimaris]MCC3860639.1 hypothetical protein [Pseudemcibacter aquimaris]WDU59458.1 hypothetical protein KW060_04195 [Pseudemcibacter aquimaris]